MKTDLVPTIKRLQDSADYIEKFHVAEVEKRVATSSKELLEYQQQLFNHQTELAQLRAAIKILKEAQAKNA